MIDAIIFFLKECWAHRRNRFIAVGGLAVLFFCLTLGSFSLSWVPEYVGRAFTFLTGTFVLASLFLMVYYIAIFIFAGIKTLLKKPIRSEADKPEALQK